MTGISLLIRGMITFLPRSQWCRSSAGFTQMAASAMMVSGRVVAITRYSSVGLPWPSET